MKNIGFDFCDRKVTRMVFRKLLKDLGFNDVGELNQMVPAILS